MTNCGHIYHLEFYDVVYPDDRHGDICATSCYKCSNCKKWFKSDGAVMVEIPLSEVAYATSYTYGGDSND